MAREFGAVTINKSGFAVLHHGRQGADIGGEDGDADRHILNRLQPAFATLPRSIGHRRKTDVAGGEIVEFSVFAPVAKHDVGASEVVTCDTDQTEPAESEEQSSSSSGAIVRK